jgi:hypothetical protein
MRVALLILVLATTSACKLATFGNPKAAHTRTSQPLSVPASPATNSSDAFQTRVKPILEARCQPCHFQGGQMYERLPFDRPATINRLGEKLFTRIKDPKEQQVIREFLASK